MLIDIDLPSDPSKPATARPGGCFSCRHLGHHLGVAVWCGRPGTEHVRFQAARGCVFWEREGDADLKPHDSTPHEATA